MGMFDSLMTNCPKCGEEHEIQVKPTEVVGEMTTFALASAPPSVLKRAAYMDVQCECGCIYSIVYSTTDGNGEWMLRVGKNVSFADAAKRPAERAEAGSRSDSPRQAKYWCVQGQAFLDTVAGRVTHGIPTFFLSADVQGILTEEGAKRVAAEIIDPCGSLELRMVVSGPHELTGKHPVVPYFEHNCELCVYLGRYSDWSYPKVDLYWCPQADRKPTVVARYGPGDYMYMSNLILARDDASPALAEAKRRAEKRGLRTITDSPAT
jgi:hypothetical protein